MTHSTGGLLTVEQAVETVTKKFAQANLFYGHGTDSAEEEALWLVFHSANIPYQSDTSALQQTLSHQQWQTIECLSQRRISERIPLAYLLGEAWFCGHAFIVNEAVLVPRSPIAELIGQHFQPWLTQSPTTVLDMCTGGGCIGIATALAFPAIHVDLADISTDALNVAQQNIVRHQVQDRVQTIKSDLFSHISHNTYDLIVANPPYVDAKDLAGMPAEYHAEPVIALGSGDDGLDIIRQLLAQAADYLSDQGIMIVETGNSWENLEKAFPRIPFLWLEFELGGHGVFVMTKDELQHHCAELQ